MDNTRKTTDTLTKDGDKALEQIRDVAETAWQQGRDTLKDLRGQGQQAIDQVQKSTQQAWDDAQKFVQKNPAKSVGIALLVGVILGGVFIALRNND